MDAVPVSNATPGSAKQPQGDHRRRIPGVLTHYAKRTPHLTSTQGSADPETVGYIGHLGWCQKPRRGWLS